MKTILLFALILSPLFADSGNLKALKIAEASSSVSAAYKNLTKRVQSIQTTPEIPEALKSLSLQILGEKKQPAFAFQVGTRISHVNEIAKELNAKLTPYMGGKPAFELSETATEKNPLFPSYNPMPFLASPGSAANGHHAYPGGLIHHTYANILSGLNWADTYEKTYQTKISKTEKDLFLLASLLHDSAKTWVLNWNEDGTLTKAEGKIAGTSAHHIWILAELAYREMPTDFIVAVAGAHDAVMEGQPSEQKVIGYLLAASIISGKNLAQVGLTQQEGKIRLTTLPRLAHYLNNLGDADWCLSVPAEKKALEFVNLKTENTPEERWKALSLLSRHGEIPLYNAWKNGADAAVKQLLSK